MSKLYEITNEMLQVAVLLATDELQPEDIGDTLDALEMEYSQKVESILKLRASLLGNALTIKQEIDRLQSLLSPVEKQISSLEQYVKGSMVSTGKDKLDLGLFKLTLRKPTKKLGAIDESKLSHEYFQVVPETRKLDKRLLLKDAKDHDIDGVELIDSERSLTIK